jgi:ubiquinone biosynthesis monooxygenase Coq7
MQKRKIDILTKEGKKALIDSIIRVNHAGEYGARRIYEGQLAFTKDANTKSKIEEMHKQELAHLNYFEQQIVENKARPTILMPLWHVGGYALGAITAFINKEAAMLCTQAVEEVIAEHYQEQIDDLEAYHIPGKEELATSIKRFRAEELEHKDIAEQNNANQAPFNKLLTLSIQNLCRAAIALSKRI